MAGELLATHYNIKNIVISSQFKLTTIQYIYKDSVDGIEVNF